MIKFLILGLLGPTRTLWYSRFIFHILYMYESVCIFHFYETERNKTNILKISVTWVWKTRKTAGSFVNQINLSTKPTRHKAINREEAFEVLCLVGLVLRFIWFLKELAVFRVFQTQVTEIFNILVLFLSVSYGILTNSKTLKQMSHTNETPVLIGVLQMILSSWIEYIYIPGYIK